MKIVFMGTPDIAVSILEKLAKTDNEIGYVVTQPDKAKNRGKKIQFTPVKEKALELGLEVLQPEKVKGNEEFYDKISAYSPDFIVVVAYGQILPKEILDIPKFFCINVHASLLPKLRGASPVQYAIIMGEEKTGVTLMEMAEGLDTGDILVYSETNVDKKNSSTLLSELGILGGNLLVEALPKIAKGEIKKIPQDNSKSSYAKLISKKDGKVDFDKSPIEIERLIRGFDPWPGAYCDYKGIQLRLWKAEPLEKVASEVNGTIVEVTNLGIEVACGEKILLISEIQVPGKKRVTVKDYLLGNKMSKGERFNVL